MAEKVNEEEGLRSVTLQNAQSILQARRGAEEELREQSNWLRVTLSSIGDAVITTDAEGRVTFMNRAAETLTAWPQAEALGRPLTDVFHIVNEQTRQPVDSPVQTVFREGGVIGLANHTTLIGRDGTERPISDSAAPIRDDAGNIGGVVMVFHDISRRRQSEAARAHLAAIVESSDDAIVSKDLQGIIRSWNKGAEKVFGYTAAETIGRPITMLIPAQYIDEEPRILERIRHGDTIDHYETVRQRKDGTLINISLTVSPIRDEAGVIIGASKIARDISDRKRAEQEREQLLQRAEAARDEAEQARRLSAELLQLEAVARAQAEEASRLKDEFLATVSHELRTPLNAILGWATTLLSGKVDEATTARAIATIERNARSQARLISDLLDVSRIITGKLRLDMLQLELAPVIRAAVEVMQPAAEAKGVRLQMVLDADVGAVSGDPERLQQVVWNLLSNAVRFTPKGGRVEVRLERRDASARVVVSDTGQGIKPEFLPHVFDRFRQGDSSVTRRQGGLGLGLAIVRHLTELHGGRVQAESPGEGQGSTFTVTLPLSAVQKAKISVRGSIAGEPRREASGLSPQAIALTDLRVLIVENEPDARTLIVTMLEQCGAEARAVASAEEALVALREWEPDVLVSDIEMPGEDGYSLIKKVRALGSEEGGLIPAAAFTAHARAEDRLRALEAGFDAHVAKPVEMVELATVIASMARRGGRRVRNLPPPSRD